MRTCLPAKPEEHQGNLCVPRMIVVVKEIPELGTGKVNHRELQTMVSKPAQP